MSWNQSDLDHLNGLYGEQMGVRAKIASQVAFLRQSGCPWSVIGEQLHMSKQGAAQRYGSRRVSLDDRPLPTPEPDAP